MYASATLNSSNAAMAARPLSVTIRTVKAGLAAVADRMRRAVRQTQLEWHCSDVLGTQLGVALPQPCHQRMIAGRGACGYGTGEIAQGPPPSRSRSILGVDSKGVGRDVEAPEEPEGPATWLSRAESCAWGI
jgi:hypothetical protein